METMTNTLPVDIKVAAPCSAKWDDMPGGDTVRSCAHCARKVYNLSEMPMAEAADLIRAAEGKLCVRFYRRADGTIMTKDCPTGIRAVRLRAARIIGVAFASILVWSGFSLSSRPRSEYPYLLRLLLDHARPETGDVAAPQNASPTPGAPQPYSDRHVMGAMIVLPMAKPTPAPQVVTGEMTTTAGASVEKPFLRGIEVDNTPRDDPFAPEAKPKTKKRVAK